MKRFITVCAVLLAVSTALFIPARAAEESPVCYPTAITVSEDGTELRKVYDLSPEADPAGIPRSDFEQGGFHYTFTDILRQELPEYEERVHTETVSFDSPKKDMESVLALLPQEREAVTEDGFLGTLSLKLDSVRVEVSGYGSTTKELSATRTYPNLDGQDTACIPKSIEDNGKTLTLQSIDWQISNAANVDGYAVGERYTAVATYTGTSTSSYVKGYTVTAEYTGTVSRINLNRGRLPGAGGAGTHRGARAHGRTCRRMDRAGKRNASADRRSGACADVLPLEDPADPHGAHRGVRRGNRCGTYPEAPCRSL